MMELPVNVQGWEFLVSVLLGVGLSLVYDLLRGVRRFWPKGTWLMDLVFGLFLLLGILWYMLYPGAGRFRMHGAAGMGLGAAAWFLAISPVFLPLWRGILRLCGRMLRLLFGPVTWILKILRQITKKYFSRISLLNTQSPNKLERYISKPLQYQKTFYNLLHYLQIK